MKAMVYRAYGPPEVLHVEQFPKPTPNDDEVLIRVMATTVAAGDWRMRKADPVLARLFNGILRPKRVNILGFEFSGIVEAIGENVTRFQPGDAVFAYSGLGFGAYAEYKCLPESGDEKKGMIALKPNNFDFQQAAAVPLGGLTALAFLRDKGGIKEGHDVMIYGASGSVGSFAVQLAKYFGACVTGVCGNANLEMVKRLGADRVMDYKSDEFKTSADRYDIIFDTVSKGPKALFREKTKANGKFFNTFQSVKFQANDLDFIKTLCEEGVILPMIDKVYDFSGIPEAHHYVESFHKKGNVVVRVAEEA